MKRTMGSDRGRGGHVQMLLGAYLLGGLSAEQEAAVRAHLDHCASCRAEHDELACVPPWLDMLTAPRAAGGLELVTDASEDQVPNDEDGPANPG